MAEEAQRKFTILIRDDTGAAVKGRPLSVAVRQLMQGTQDRLTVTANRRVPRDFEVEIVSDNDLRPYSVSGTKARISYGYYRNRDFTIGAEYYVTYFIAISLMEFWYQKVRGSGYRVIRETDLPGLNLAILGGSLPAHTSSAFRLLADSMDEQARADFYATNKLFTSARSVHDRLQRLCREVGDTLTSYHLPSATDPASVLYPILANADQERVEKMAAGVVADDPKGLFGLIELLEDDHSQPAINLLSDISKAKGNMDDLVRGYAERAFDRISRGTRRGSSRSLDLPPFFGPVITSRFPVSLPIGFHTL